MSSIIFKNVTKAYSKEYGLIDFDCEIKSGEFITVIGQSGSGKSTFLKIIAGLLKPDCGELYINDELVNDVPASKRDVAMMFQEYVLYPNFNVYENVGAYLKFNNVDQLIIHEKVMNALKLFDLHTLANRRIKELSGGQQQRVALAKLFVRNPKVILFDEPLSNIDEVNKKQYRNNITMLKELLPETTFVYVTHNLGEALTLGERIMMIEDGRCIFTSKPSALIDYPIKKSLIEMFNNTEVKPSLVPIEQLDDFYSASINDKGKIKEIMLNNKKHLAYDDSDNLLGGVQPYITLEGTLLGKSIKFNDFSIHLNDEMCSRLLLNNCRVKVSFDVEKFHSEKFTGDFSVCFNKICEEGKYSLLEINGENFVVNSDSKLLGEKLYYNINDIKIYTLDNQKVLSNYIIYPNVINVLNKRNNILVNRDKIAMNKYLKNNNLYIPLTGVSGLSNKKGLNKILIDIISEEIVDENKKLVYALVKNSEHYITFYLDKNIKINYDKKNYIILKI